MTLQGIIVPVITPVNADEELDLRLGRRLLSYLVAEGVHGLFLFGSSGCYACFDFSERQPWIEEAVAAGGGRTPVLVGVQAAATRHVERLARQAYQAGAQGIVLLPPHPLPVRRRADIVRFFIAAAHASPLPLIIYHNPSLGHPKLEPVEIEEMLAAGNVIGIKDTSYDFLFFRNLVRRFGARADFAVLQGAIPYADASLFAGAQGLVPGTGSLAPALWVQLYQAAQAGDWSQARHLQERLLQLNRIYGEGSNLWPSALHYACSLRGLCQPYVRRPYMPLTEKDKMMVQDCLNEFGLNTPVPAAG